MSSRPQVTITLGRSGQVVKRERTASDVSSSDYAPSMEGKPSIRERLGNNGQYLYESQYSKRQRTGNYEQSNNHMEDGKQQISNLRVSRDDLRYKLMSKSQSRSEIVSAGQNGVDLREKLSRNSRIPLRYESRNNMLESRNSALSSGIPPTRNADDLLRLDSSRKSYPSLMLDGLRHRSPDGLRHRSPDGLLGAPRHVSPKRNYDEVRHNPSVRLYDDSRPIVHVKRSIPETSSPSVFMSKTVVPVDSSKSVFRALPGAIQKIPYMPEEKITVSGLLHSLGLGKYAINFQAEEVDMAVLRQMGDGDLKELGIPMGPRKKIMLALLPRSKQRQN